MKKIQAKTSHLYILFHIFENFTANFIKKKEKRVLSARASTIIVQ